VDHSRFEEFDRLISRDVVSSQYEQQIDSELANLERVALQLKARRNACQSISRLPPEITGEIIKHVATISPPHRPVFHSSDRGISFDLSHSRSDLGWIKLAHVCHRWREIALGISSLWADSVCSLTGAEETFLERARAIPLVLSINARHHKIDEQTVWFIQEYRRRARVIEIHEVLPPIMHPAAWPTGARGLAGQDFPYLEELVLDLKPSRKEPVSHSVFSLPPLRANKLRRIELNNIFVPWSVTPNLTELILSRNDFQQLSIVPPPELLFSLLRSAPMLHTLHLLGWIPDIQRLERDEGEYLTYSVLGFFLFTTI
jgi:hypothetical protein